MYFILSCVFHSNETTVLYKFCITQCLPGGFRHIVGKMTFNNYRMAASD